MKKFVKKINFASKNWFELRSNPQSFLMKPDCESAFLANSKKYFLNHFNLTFENNYTQKIWIHKIETEQQILFKTILNEQKDFQKLSNINPHTLYLTKDHAQFKFFITKNNPDFQISENEFLVEIAKISNYFGRISIDFQTDEIITVLSANTFLWKLFFDLIILLFFYNLFSLAIKLLLGDPNFPIIPNADVQKEFEDLKKMINNPKIN